MHIQFCFNTSIIRNMGQDEFEFLINNQVMHLFTLPNYRTSIHDINNWLFNLDGPQDELPSPLKIPQIYDHFDAYLFDADSSASVVPAT